MQDSLMHDSPDADRPPSAAENSLLLVDDDAVFCGRMAEALGARGFAVEAVTSGAEGIAAFRKTAPAFAVIDMRLGDGSGLDVMSKLKEEHPATRAIMLTGYGNITTAVTAAKLGAFDYLAKPADADEVRNALLATRHDRAAIPDRPMTADRVRYDHIREVFEQHGRNVSETVRKLNMHRRTLQRILAKRAPH